VTITLHPLNEAGRLLLATECEDAMHTVYASSDQLRADVESLAIQVERLLKERALIVDVLSQFYRSDISISSLQPVMDIAVQLNPSLKEPR